MKLLIAAGEDRMNQKDKRRSFRVIVFWYHSLPLITVFVLLATFLLVSFATNNYFAAFAAFVTSSFMLWRWVCAGREVDRWLCAKCGQPFSNIKKMMWKYPPDDCPLCENPFV
jgi:hypothetical protein